MSTTPTLSMKNEHVRGGCGHGVGSGLDQLAAVVGEMRTKELP